MKQLGLGSYRTAWMLCHKLRRAMVDPERGLLSGWVEVDETLIPYRTKQDSLAGYELTEDTWKTVADRIRLVAIPDYTRETFPGFLHATVATGSTILTDGIGAMKDSGGKSTSRRWSASWPLA